MTKKEYYAGETLISKSQKLYELSIEPGAVLKAPEGMYLSLSVNGVGKPIKPGYYKGDIDLTVAKPYVMQPHGLMKMTNMIRDHYPVAHIDNNRLVEDAGVPGLLQNVSLSGDSAEGGLIASEADDVTGILITGDSSYQVKDMEFCLEGEGHDDFSGMGSGVIALDSSKVQIDNCSFRMGGETRCAVHVGGDSEVHVNHCKISNYSLDSGKIGSFSWQVGFVGSNRLCQLTDNARAYYTDCDLETNGWGILSIDGSDERVELRVKDSRLTLSGTRAHGYGAFCIGENLVSFDHCDVNVNGYPFMLMGMEGKAEAEIKNGTLLRGRRFGVMIDKDDNSRFVISDSVIDTGKSSIVMKGSATTIDISNTQFRPGNGVVLQLMDNDEAAMDAMDYKIPVGVVDTPIPGRVLTSASPTEDVRLNISDCDITGDFYNSTTNIRAYKRSTRGGMGKFHDSVVGIFPEPPIPDPDQLPDPSTLPHGGDDLQGPKNLEINLNNSKITGVISAASQKYRDGLHVIDEKNRMELSSITQSAAEPVNNGVIVRLDAKSSWTVTGACYLTALHIDSGAALTAPDGKKLLLTVNGAPTEIAPGSYEGNIALTVS